MSRSSTFLAMISTLAIFVLGCHQAEVEDADDDDGKADDLDSGFRLPGFAETLLVASAEGDIAIVDVGPESFKNQRVDRIVDSAVTAVRTRGREFFVAFASGHVAAISADSAEVTAGFQLDPPINDLALSTNSTAYFSVAGDRNAVHHVDLETGDILETLEVAAEDSDAEPRSLLIVENELYVVVDRGFNRSGEVVVIDIENHQIKKRIALEVVEPQSGTVKAGLSPGLPLVFDKKHDQVLVTATGERPFDTGFVARIDRATLTLSERWVRAQSGFQGTIALDGASEHAFVIYHTSTPTTSSHLFWFPVDDRGEFIDSGEAAVLDTFDGTDDLRLNTATTLAAMTNNCAAGFCIGGQGINFVEVATGEKLPKLFAEDVGFVTTISHFAESPPRQGECFEKTVRPCDSWTHVSMPEGN